MQRLGKLRSDLEPIVTAIREYRKVIDDLSQAEEMLNDPEMKELAAKSGFELVNVGSAEMDAFMTEKVKLYFDGAKRLGLGK